MAIYQYKAKNNHQETVTGKVEAQRIEQAQAILRDRGLFVITVKEVHDRMSGFEMMRGVKRNDVIAFTRQLSTMITAGLSLLDALTILERQSTPAMRLLVNELIRDVEGGSTFASALKSHPKVFSRIYYNLVKAGETAGVLADVLRRLADNLEKEKEFRGKVKGALIYPAIVVIAMTVVIFLMMIFVIPKLSDMYRDFGAELPILTQMLIGFSTFIATYWYVFIVGVVGAFFGMRAWRKTPMGAMKYDTMLLKLPVFGPLRQKIVLTEFARTMSLLLGAGISLLEALEITAEGIDNVVYRTAVQDAYRYVEKGSSLALALEKYEMFPGILPQMISVGEETGQLDEVLMKVAVYFETESEQAVKAMTTALEPMIMIILGLGVGFLVVAIVMPIYSLTNQF